MIQIDNIYNEDCLKGMARIADKSVDAVVCDLPYGILNRRNKNAGWDRQIPLEPLWEQYRRIIKPDSPVILFGQGMFTARLLMSQSELWRYNLVWYKDRASGHLNANRMPLRKHEDILVFYEHLPVYHPQMVPCDKSQRNHGRCTSQAFTNRCYGNMRMTDVRIADDKYPTSVIQIPKEHKTGTFFHPTQKPVALVEYLIRTYTDEGDVVLDNVNHGDRRHPKRTSLYRLRDRCRLLPDSRGKDKGRETHGNNKRKTRISTMRTMLSKILAAFLITAAFQPIKAQTTYQEMEQLTVNEQVTTVITASEPIRFVDISTDLVAGDQPINNTVRLKPKEAGHEDGEVLAIVTIVTERYRTQYALLYTTRLTEAVTSKEIELSERNAYHNPAVSMSTEDMYRYARQIWTSPARFRNVGSKKHRMTMRLNNIYSAGDYFFLDFSVENRTNIRFDIDEVRLKLSDKKVSKATNSQVVELKPELILEQSRSFLHGYRNVIVVKKLTFPNDKVLTVELTEKQISGRTISLNIDYEDVLSADGFSNALLREE